MHRAALLAFGILVAASSLALGQGLPEGTFASSKEGCDKLKEKTVAELGQALDFTVFSKTGVDANAQHCDLVSVTPRNATSWLATAFCEEPGYAFPDVFAILQKKTGDLRVTRMTVQQESYDEPEDEVIGVRRRSRSLGDGPARKLRRRRFQRGHDRGRRRRPQRFFPLRRREAVDP